MGEEAKTVERTLKEGPLSEVRGKRYTNVSGDPSALTILVYLSSNLPPSSSHNSCTTSAPTSGARS